jgi:hypothetical protein
VEVVRKDSFVQFVEGHLTEFVNSLDARIRDHHALVMKGRAAVIGLERGESLEAGVLNRLAS